MTRPPTYPASTPHATGSGEPPSSGGEPAHSHHHRHHHHRSRTDAPGIAFALAACLLFGWSLVPLASVGFFETRIVAMGVWSLAALACLLPRGGGPVPSGRAWCALAAALALWCGIQLLPVPAGLPPFWRGDPAVFARIAAHAGGRLRMAVVPYHAFHTAIHWAGLFALSCAAAHRLRGKTTARVLLAGLVLGTLLESLFAFSRDIGTGERMHGTFANSDAFGGLLAMSLPLTVALFLDRAASKRHAPYGRRAAARTIGAIAVAALFLFQMVVLFFTGSRGATAAAAIPLLLLLAWCWAAFPTRRKALLAGLLLLLCLVPAFFIHARRFNVWDRLVDAQGSLDTGITARSRIWEAGLALLRGFPLGTGPGGTTHVIPMYQSGLLGRHRLDYAHNDTLQFLGDLGWPGGALLLCGLFLLARQALRAVRAPAAADASPPWLERGAALALLAALVHSQVEFNLSARPPLQLAFALLAGLLFAAPGSASGGDRSRGARPAWTARIPVLLAAAAAVVLSFRAAVAYRAARSIAQSAGLAAAFTDSPLLLPAARPLPIPPDDPDIERASLWGADSPFVQGVLATLPRFNHRHAVVSTARAQEEAANGARDDEDVIGVAPSPGTPPAPARDLNADDSDDDSDFPDPPLPPPEFMAQASLALRFEEAQAVREALPHADAALRLAPWSVQAMTDRAWLLLRATVLRTLPAADLPAAAAEAHADLDLAATLFPSDAHNLADICAALAAEENTDGNLPRIRELAERAFALDPRAALASMDRWWNAGIPILPLVHLDTLPVSALISLYKRTRASGDDAEADEILDLVVQRTRPGTLPPPAAAHWTPARLAFWNTSQVRARLWAVRHRLIRNLLEGDWAAVAASAPDRADARILRFHMRFAPLASSPTLLRLRLRDWNQHNLLPLHWRVEWALSECAVGRNPELFRDVWADAARHPPLPKDQADRLPASVRAEFPSLAAPDASPASPAPASSLELPFLGERIVLESVAIETPAKPTAAPRLLLAWRFDAPPLPPDLLVRVRIRDANRTLLLSRHLSFGKYMPGFFQGRPETGSRHVFSIPLSPVAAYAKTIGIQLADGQTRFPQDDLRAYPVFDYPSLPRVAPPTAEDTTAEDTAAEDPAGNGLADSPDSSLPSEPLSPQETATPIRSSKENAP